MVGSRQEASEIMDAWHTGDDLYYNPPAGWTWLGSGSFRQALRAPSGTVYKLSANDTWDSADLSNRTEYEIMTKYADRNWAPPTSIYTFGDDHSVIAMPYLEDDESDLTHEGAKDLREITRLITDSSGRRYANYLVINGRPVLIDAGGYDGQHYP